MMKMVLILCRSYLEEAVQELLAREGVRAFSEVPRVFGCGAHGTAADTRVYPGENIAVFAAVPDDQVQRIGASLERFTREREEKLGRSAPLQAFVLPCEPLLAAHLEAATPVSTDPEEAP